MAKFITLLVVLLWLISTTGIAQQIQYKEQWIAIAGDTRVERSNAIIADSLGNSYLTGHSQLVGDESSRLMYLVKFDTKGNLEWEQTFDFGVGSDGQKVVVDGSELVVTTESNTDNGIGTTLSRHNVDSGELLSKVQISIGRNTTVYDFLNQAAGHFIIVGRANRERDSNIFGFIAKIDTEGTLIWEREIGADNYTIVREVAIDDEGGLYITGHSSATTLFGTPSIGLSDTFVAKYDSSGNLIWGKRYGSQFNDFGITVSLTDEGHMLAGGSGNGRFDQNDEFINRIFYIVKLDTGTGDIVRTTYYNPGGDFYLRKIIATGGDSFVFTGWTNGSFFNTVHFQGDVGVFGEVRNWRLVPESFQHIQSRFSYGHSITQDSDGSIYWTGFAMDGFFNNPQQNSSYNVFVAKLTPVPSDIINVEPWVIESIGERLLRSQSVHIGLLVLFVSGIIYSLRRRKAPTSNIGDVALVELMQLDSKLFAIHDQTQRVEFEGREKLLAQLLYQALKSNKVILNDEVDDLLLPNHPSPDYVRKIRNVTLDKLESRLQTFCPLPDGASYIIRTVYATDRRKSEYQFNPKFVSLAESTSQWSATA